MNTDGLITALAGVLVLLPNTAALVVGLQLTPGEQLVLLVLAGIGAAILKQQNPSGSLSSEDVRRLQDELARLKRIAPLRDDLEAKRREGSRG